MRVNEYTLPQLVDLALRVPEIGAVNFNILHTVLHAIIEQAGIESFRPWCNIESPENCSEALKNPELCSYVQDVTTDEESSAGDSTAEHYGPEEERQEEEGEEREERDEEEEREEKDEEEESSEIADQAEVKVTKKIVARKHSSHGTHDFSGMWKLTNLSKRVDAVEEAVEAMSTILDKFQSHLNSVTENNDENKTIVDELDSNVKSLLSELEALRDISCSKDDLEELKARTEAVEENKMDKSELHELIAARHPSTTEGEEEEISELELLKHKVENLNEEVEFLMKTLHITYDPEHAHDTDEGTEEEGDHFKTLDERFDEIWEKLAELTSGKTGIGGGGGGAEFDPQKHEDQERIVRSMVTRTDALELRMDDLEEESKLRGTAVESLLNNVNELQYSKVDKETFETALEGKADKAEVDSKVSREEFVATVLDLGDSIEGLVEKTKAIEEEHRIFAAKVEDELKLKLSIADYETLQIPVHNRIRALMYGFKKMKDVIQNTLYPEAAGVTKCVSCGRPAEIAGKPGGDADGRIPEFAESSERETLSLDNLRFHDGGSGQSPAGSDRSFTSLPETAVNEHKRKLKRSQRRDGQAQKLGVETPKSSEEMDREMGKEGSTSTLKTQDNLSTSKEDYAQSLSVIGLAQRKAKSEIDAEFDEMLSVSDSKRFCGGAHTTTPPLHKGIKMNVAEIPSSTKHKAALVGYDQAWYKGAFPPLNPDSDNKELEVDETEIDEILKSCDEQFPELPPRKFTTSRSCGGPHTMTEPLQKELRFATVEFEDIRKKRSSLPTTKEMNAIKTETAAGLSGSNTSIPPPEEPINQVPNQSD